MKSEKLFRESLNIFPGGVNSPVRYYKPYPIFIKKGKGSRIYDVDDKSYIDYCLAYGPLILGHSDKDIKKEIKKQLENGWIYGAPTELEIIYGNMLKGATGMEMMRFTSSGTEATMHAIRLARAYTKRNKILKLYGGFHGSHDSVLISPGSGAIGIPSSPGIPKEVAENTLVANYNDIKGIKEVFSKEGKNIAAVIVEPVLGNVGVIIPEKNFLNELKNITEKYKSLLIFDEVITGFRFHYGTASKYFDISPDITILGKIVGGGLPLAVFGGKEEIMKNIAPSGKVYQAGTYSGNPLSIAAGIATLKKLKNLDYKELEKKLNILIKYIGDASHDKKIKISFNGIVSMFQIFFTTNKVKDYPSALTSDANKYYQFFQKLLKKGIYIPPSQYETLFLSFSHTNKEIEYTGQVIYETL